MMNHAIFLYSKHQIILIIERLFKKAHKRLIERQLIFKQCQQWPQEAHLGNLLHANIYQIHKGMNSITVADWEHENHHLTIPLNPLIPIHEQVAKYFKRSKKLHTGEVHALRQLKIVEEELLSIQKQQKEIQAIEDMPALEKFCRTYNLNLTVLTKSKLTTPAHSKPKSLPKPYQAYKSLEDIEIWVGKNAKCNDQMTFIHANGSDWWLHARNTPGSHVVIHCQKGKEPNPATIADAAELALRFSKNKESYQRGAPGEVSLTQIKWLKRVKGIPGRVMVPKHKTLIINLDDVRWERLRASKRQI